MIPFHPSFATTTRVVGLAGVAALAACTESLRDVRTVLCSEDSRCPGGFVCQFPAGAAGGLGICSEPAVPCGETFCGAGEVCVVASIGGCPTGFECRKGCTGDDECAPAGLCVLAWVSATSRAGACEPCPACENGRSCAKRRVADVHGDQLYCNAPGDDCASGKDTDGDGEWGCEDFDCFGSPYCDSCGDYSLDPGESCDGPPVGIDCSQLDADFLASSSPSCGGRCFFDASPCKPKGDVCGDIRDSSTKPECEPWTDAAGLPVGDVADMAMAYRSGRVWMVWRSGRGVETASCSPGGDLSPAGAVTPPGMITGRAAIGFDQAARPVVAYTVTAPNRTWLHVARYVDGTWSPMGQPGSEGAAIEIPASAAALAVVPTGVWVVGETSSPLAVKAWFVTDAGVIDYPAEPMTDGLTGPTALAVDEAANEPILGDTKMIVEPATPPGWSPKVTFEPIVLRLSGSRWSELGPLGGTYPRLSWGEGVLVGTASAGGRILNVLSPSGFWSPPPGWNTATARVSPDAMAAHGGMPVVAWAASDGVHVEAYEGENRGWRGLAGNGQDTVVDAAGSGPAALAVATEGGTPRACLAYVARTAGASEVRVRCHALRR